MMKNTVTTIKVEAGRQLDRRVIMSELNEKGEVISSREYADAGAGRPL
jgi:hypothetical protein